MTNAWLVRSLGLLVPLVAAAGVAQVGPRAENSLAGMEPVETVQARGSSSASLGQLASETSASYPPEKPKLAAPANLSPLADLSPETPPETPPAAPPETPPAAPPEISPPETPPIPALRRLSAPPQNLELDQQIFGTAGSPGDRPALLQAIDYSLVYINSDKAAADYADYPIAGISRDRVRRSLQHFRQLVSTSPSAAALHQAVLRDFDFYQATGTDGQGTVHFTGYFEPTYAASRQPTAEYRYPLYRLPPDLERWPEPHPDRLALEGKDGLQAAAGPLKGLELVWLKDRMEAFLVQVQGSAKLQLTDGSTMSVGYAGRTNYPYVSVGRELVNDGLFSLTELSLPLMLDYFQKTPQALSEYLPRNPRFVFFKQTDGAPPTGSLSQPVTADRSLATDKSLMPPGALTLLNTTLPYANPGAVLQSRRYVKRAVSRYGLDQDTGGAIQGPGRADIFLGSGVVAGDRAGLVNDNGQLYYLLIKDGR